MDPADQFFISPTNGRLDSDQLVAELTGFVSDGAGYSHRLIIGTDSFVASETVFVTAVVVHRVGRGGRYFYRKTRARKMPSIRQRIIYEATMSIELAGVLRTQLDGCGHGGLAVEIHIDAGEGGESRSVIREVVGMVRGSGYEAVIKPGSYGATKVADRHSR